MCIKYKREPLDNATNGLRYLYIQNIIPSQRIANYNDCLELRRQTYNKLLNGGKTPSHMEEKDKVFSSGKHTYY